MMHIKIRRSVLSALLAALIALPMAASAATLSISPASATVTAGDTITATVIVDSEGVAINSAEGALVFPRDLFDVVSINKEPSLFSLWIQAPAYDGNNAISFNGGIPSPGYQGSNGKLFSVTLRALSAGTARISIDNGAVRANDGLGTDVMRAAGAANIVLTAAAKLKPAEAPSTPAATISAESHPPSSLNSIVVTSPTHPSEDAWYAAKKATLRWDLPKGADAVRTILSETEGETPTVTYSPAIREKDIDLDEGIWYFNIRARTAGVWGPTTSYRMQVDATPPVVSGLALTYDTEQKALVLVAAAADILKTPDHGLSLRGVGSDALSGVSEFHIIVDGAVAASIPEQAMNGETYRVPLTFVAGPHTAALRISDKAGNMTDSTAFEFAVEEPPTFGESIVRSLQSLDNIYVLLMLALVLSIASVSMNIIFWRRLRHLEADSGMKPGVNKIQRNARLKLVTLKRDLQRQAKDLEELRNVGQMSSEDTAYLKKIHTHLREVEDFLDGKISET